MTNGDEPPHGAAVDFPTDDPIYLEVLQSGFFGSPEETLRWAVRLARDLFRESNSHELWDLGAYYALSGPPHVAELVGSQALLREQLELNFERQQVAKDSRRIAQLRIRRGHSIESLSTATALPSRDLRAFEDPGDITLPTPREFSLIYYACTGRSWGDEQFIICPECCNFEPSEEITLPPSPLLSLLDPAAIPVNVAVLERQALWDTPVRRETDAL